MNDILTEEDVKLFCDEFYKSLLSDERINHHFLDLNIDEHMPKIYHFWNSILLGIGIFKGNMMESHKNLNLNKEDFPIWLRYFESTIRKNFEGEKADEAISRANTIAMTMRFKLLGEI